jgi:hypothetical protein
MHFILALHGHGGTPFTMAIIALVGALAMVTLNTQETLAIASVGNAGQGRAVGGSSGAGGGPYIDPSLFCNTGVTTPICTSSNTPSNQLHPRPLINHLSVRLHPTGDSRGSSRHHYHNISHNIIIISHNLHHGKSSGYAGSFGEGPGGSFGEGPGGSFGEGPGGSFGEGPHGDYP